MKKMSIFVITFLLLVSISSTNIKAAYNYSPLGDVVASAEALIVKKVVDSSNTTNPLGQRVFVNYGTLVDVFSFQDKIYLVDSGNSIIHVLDGEFHYLESFGSSNGPGKLASPRGIFVNSDEIHVADYGNYRVAVFNHQYEFVKEITTPNDPTFKQFPSDANGYDFKPLKVAADRTGRVYVIADQIFEGIVDFNPDGTFSRYIGGNTITLSLWDAFWLRFTTEQQRKAQGFRLATTFINLNVDQDGYIYTVSSSGQGQRVIKKLNYKGKDVLVRNGYVPQIGDVHTVFKNTNVPTGSSEFIDIDVNEIGTYSVLDKTRGRIFTYDFEGNLLYIGGQLGNVGGAVNNQSSLFNQPEALSYHGNQILVVDSLNKNLVVLEYTEFAQLVNFANQYYFHGDYERAGQTWREVLVLNTNYYLAYAGIGKAQLREGNYRQAMANAKRGYDDYTYSKAYQPYRYNQLTAIFPYLAGTGLACVAYLFGKSIYRSVKAEKEEEEVA